MPIIGSSLPRIVNCRSKVLSKFASEAAFTSPAQTAINGGVPDLPVKWFVDTLTDAFAHEIPAPELHEWLRRAIETLRLRAVVVSSTRDQVLGLARELRDDFGLLAEGVVSSVRHLPAIPRHIQRR